MDSQLAKDNLNHRFYLFLGYKPFLNPFNVLQPISFMRRYTLLCGGLVFLEDETIWFVWKKESIWLDFQPQVHL